LVGERAEKMHKIRLLKAMLKDAAKSIAYGLWIINYVFSFLYFGTFPFITVTFKDRNQMDPKCRLHVLISFGNR
jgi:hypothetical protein